MTAHKPHQTGLWVQAMVLESVVRDQALDKAAVAVLNERQDWGHSNLSTRSSPHLAQQQIFHQLNRCFAATTAAGDQ